MTATQTPTNAFRHDHADLLDHVEHIRLAASEVAELSPEERRLVIRRVLDFLEGRLVPHAEAEVHVLYPEVAKLLGHSQSTLPMIYDHLAIRRRISDLHEADPQDTARLQELLYGLHALVEVHFWKEEELYLPLLDSEGSPEVRRLLETLERLENGGASATVKEGPRS